MFPSYKTFACFAVGVVALAAVEAGQLHAQVLDRLERMLDEQFVGSIDASRLTGTLLWGFTAHDVEVRDGRGQLVAHIEEFQVDASAFELLDGNLRFDRARFVRPIVLVEPYADGRKNVEEIFRSRQPSEGSKPPGEVLFEMSRAEVIDGQFYNLEPVGPTASTALIYSSDQKTAMHATSSRAINLEGSLQVRSGRQASAVVDRLDAEILTGKPRRPRRLSVKRVEIDTDAGALGVRVGRLAVDDRWQVDDLVVSKPSKYAAGAGRVAVHGRASSAKGGWLEVRGFVDGDDQSYDFTALASDFEPSDWPGAPDWSWLVLDGAGEVSGRGWSGDDIDATVRWTSHDLDVADEQLDRLHLVAHISERRVEVETLDVSADGFSGTASGHISEDGAFALESDSRIDAAFAKRLADRNTTSALVAQLRGDQLRKVARLDLASKVSGTLDFTGRNLMQLVEEAKADVTWKARDVILDQMRWDVAGGSLGVKLPRARRGQRGQRGNRKFTYKLSAALHDLHHGPFSARILRTSMRGNAVFDARAGLEGVNYRLEVDGDGVEFSDMKAKAIRLRLSGALSPSQRGADWPIETLAAKGTLDLVGYHHDDLSAQRVAANIDVSGKFPAGEGTILAHATGLRTPDRRFRHAQMELDLLEGQKFRLKSKARVEISLIPDLPLYLDVSGRHARNLAALSLDKFSVGRPGMRWKIRKPGLVRFADGAVILQSLMLQRHSQQVRLDGEFGSGKSGSISDICKRLTSAQIRSFFDFGSIF